MLPRRFSLLTFIVTPTKVADILAPDLWMNFLGSGKVFEALQTRRQQLTLHVRERLGPYSNIVTI